MSEIDTEATVAVVAYHAAHPDLPVPDLSGSDLETWKRVGMAVRAWVLGDIDYMTQAGPTVLALPDQTGDQAWVEADPEDVDTIRGFMRAYVEMTGEPDAATDVRDLVKGG